MRNERRTYTSISIIINWSRIKPSALERSPLARRVKVTLHSGMKAGKEMELQGIAHISRRCVRRKDKSAHADVDLDYFCDCAASCHQGDESN